jgi:hypothetical protein
VGEVIVVLMKPIAVARNDTFPQLAHIYLHIR